jgi:hypothetical protein
LSDGDPPSTVSTSLGEPEVAVEGIVHSSVASASPSRETSDSEADDESMTVTNSDSAGSKTGDLSLNVGNKPTQPILSKYPTTKFGAKDRSFNADWYHKYPWLEYSVRHDAGFCYACRHFQIGSCTGRIDPAFVKNSYRNWKKATGKDGLLKKHAESLNHRAAMQVWQQHRTACKEKAAFGVDQQLRDIAQEDIQSNRFYLKSIMEVVLTLAHQNIPLRGHDESESSLNPGNFLTIFNLLVSHDPHLKQKRLSAPKNATYLSPEIQNSVLSILAKMVKEQICSEVTESGAYTIMADETRDVSKTEQLSIVLRYVFQGHVYERFLGFVPLDDLSSAGIAHSITGALSESHIDLNLCVSQSYDGASVMSGRVGGIQAKIKDLCPQATYCHCYAHRLNLVLVNCCKVIPEVHEYFSLLQSLYVFVSSAAVHCVFERVQENMKIKAPKYTPVRLKRLSDTRWACRVESVQAIRKGYPAITQTLCQIVDGDANRERAVEARGLWHQIQSLQFIVCTIVFEKVLLLTNGLSEVLQAKELDLAAAVDLVDTTRDTLQNWRNNSASWTKLWTDIASMVKDNGLSMELSRKPRRRLKQSTRMNESVVMETVGVRRDEMEELESEDIDLDTHYRISIYNATLDQIIGEMDRRFSVESRSLMTAASACSPRSPSFLNFKVMEPLVKHSILHQQTGAE